MKNFFYWEMESGSVHTYYMLNYQMRNSLFHSFFGVWFLKICMFLSEHPVPITYNVHERRKQQKTNYLSIFDDQNKVTKGSNVHC